MVSRAISLLAVAPFVLVTAALAQFELVRIASHSLRPMPPAPTAPMIVAPRVLLSH